MPKSSGVVSGNVEDKVIVKALCEESCRAFIQYKLLIMNFYEPISESESKINFDPLPLLHFLK